MDRDYWRSETTARLIEEARTKGCELCRALGERMEDAEYDNDGRVEDAQERAHVAEHHAKTLDDTIYELEVENDKLLSTIERMAIEIAELKRNKND